MANMYQGNFAYRTTRRYTIPHLLQLAQGRLSFDLSKFSYDAARAGVVPPLGDCVMASRRSSNSRPRGWSSASFETNEDVVVFGGNTNSANIVKPERQPVNPPSEVRSEKDVGFARFLKKHASPTHNRVTAGGRIVPMETRESPPRFTLAPSAQSPGQTKPYIKQEGVGSPHLCGISNHRALAAFDQTGILAATNSTREVTVGQSTLGYGTGSNVSLPQQVISTAELTHNPIENASVVPQGIPENQVSPYLAQMQLQNGHNYYSPQMTYFSMQSLNPYAGYAWPSPDMYNMASMGTTGNFHSESQMHMAWSGRQILSDAEALFNNLDRQLKLIDRHRAMNTHDPNLSAQRMAIVQQRAEAMETVKRLKTQLGVVQSQVSFPGRIPFTAAMTPAFVPASMASMQQQAAAPSTPSDVTIKAPVIADKSHSTSKRKPIPIVPPPAPPAAPAAHVEPCKKDNKAASSPVKADTRFESNHNGDLQSRHEHEGAESLSGDTSTMQQQSKAEAEPDSKELPPSQDINQGHQQSTRLLQTEWMEVLDGEPPAEVEAIYELQLDAMRLPEGANALLQLSNGSVVTVPGCKLDRPLLSLMSDMEKDYWDRKPVFTMEMLQNLRTHAKIQFLDITLTDEYLVASLGGPPASPDKETSTESKAEERVQKYVEDQSKCQGEYAELREMSSKSELSNKQITVGQRGMSSTEEVVKGAGPLAQAIEVLRSETECVALDEMSHKGYSSVSIQNINVQVQLPPPGFDGATDSNRRSAAVSSLTAAGKQRSPRLVHRSTPNGGA